MGGFIFLIVLVFAVWVLAVMPARKRRSEHAAMQDSVGLGDDVITAGGLHGTVREVADETLRIEIAPGVVATLDRRAVAAVAREIEVQTDAEAG